MSRNLFIGLVSLAWVWAISVNPAEAQPSAKPANPDKIIRKPIVTMNPFGAQGWYPSLTLHYPRSRPFPLPKELRSLEDAAKELLDEQQPAPQVEQTRKRPFFIPIGFPKPKEIRSGETEESENPPRRPFFIPIGMQTDPEWVRNRLGEKLTIEQQLRRPISLHFKEVPLNQAVKDLSLLTGVKIVLDLPDLEAAKIHLDVPLSINVENIDMKSALRLLLNRLRLAYVIENQTIKITTPEKAHPLFQRAYSVADLVEPVPLFEGQKSRKPNDAVLVECIQSCAATSSWEANGGKGTIQYFPKDRSLVITQHVEAHEEVALLLATLRKLQELTVSAEVRFIQASTDVARQWRGTMAQDGTRIVSFRELKAVDSAEPRFLMRSGAPGLIEEDESELRTFVALDNARAEQLLKLAQGDRSSSIIQAPKLSVFNGQRIPFECLRKESVIVEFKTRGTEGKEEGVSTPVRDVIVGGWRCKLQPVVSPDRRFVRLSLDVQHFTRDNASSVELSTKATKTFNVSDGATLLWDLGETAERQHLFVLVTPRIHAREEEEQIFLGEIRR